MEVYYKTPRLYLNSSFAKGAVLPLEDYHVHYLKNVLRKQRGDAVRVFNGVDGEWLTHIQDFKKKSGQLLLDSFIREQSITLPKFDLYFSPVQKNRMHMLVEKAVELGVSSLNPVLMNRTEFRTVNSDRITANIIEAAEQCERLDVPVLKPVRFFKDCLDLDLFVCVERSKGAKSINQCDFSGGGGFMIGPPGGFNDEEISIILGQSNLTSISLSDNVLRSETAAISALSYAMLSQQ